LPGLSHRVRRVFTRWYMKSDKRAVVIWKDGEADTHDLQDLIHDDLAYGAGGNGQSALGLVPVEPSEHLSLHPTTKAPPAGPPAISVGLFFFFFQCTRRELTLPTVPSGQNS